jgi:hypothetical protein
MAGIWSTRLMAGLTTTFNVLALNLVLLLVSLPVITAPAAIEAASVALDRWRRDGEDRVVREFLIALRAGSPVRVTVVLGVPLAVIGLGLAEALHFARASAPTDRVSLGICLAALLIALTATGYVIELASARSPVETGSAVDTWSLAVRLAVRNLAVTGPLFLAEVAATTALTMIDPGLLLLGLPVVLLYLTKRTARLGLRRFDLAV